MPAIIDKSTPALTHEHLQTYSRLLHLLKFTRFLKQCRINSKRYDFLYVRLTTFLCLFCFYCFDIQLFILLLQSIQFLLLLYLAAQFFLGGKIELVFAGKQLSDLEIAISKSQCREQLNKNDGKRANTFR